MNTPDAKSVFGRAAEIPDPAARAAYLDLACAGRPDVRAEVETLLQALEDAGSFMRGPAAVPADQTGEYHDERVTEGEGTVIGPYTLREQIGEGGMGLVFVAEQTHPVRRKVALKLIKPGMDTRQVVARFEAERQALALMDHPNIAKVLDAGTTASGLPYFVMELVRGVPITEYADANKFTPQQRLELFVQVCHAVQHAHQKGVIHRDLKPSNILVTSHDGVPVAKVIDFGVAKAVGQTLTEKTIYTRFAQMVGTPLYMSPEQAEFSGLDVDTRSDVYALGVVLYELLTGTTPFDGERFRKAAFDEMRRIIKEEEPPRPSTRLTCLGATLTAVSAKRGTDPGKLAGVLRGELDWIVMRCLEKDRTRRYDGAAALVKDVQRYLTGDAVEACPPTLGYRLQKAYRRNRAAMLVGLVFTLMLLTGVAVASVLAIQARRAEAQARRAEAIAETKRTEAEEQRQKAERLFATNSAMQEAYLEAAVEAEIRNNSSRLDADLLEYKSDTRVGLLRLARPLKNGIGPIKSDFPLPNSEHFMGFKDNPEFVKLREFQAAAVITAGQKFEPLVPPIHHDGLYPRRSLKQRLCIIGDERYGLKLIAVPSLQQLGVLREGNERLVNWDFSPDGKTIYTKDTDSILRFWNADGTFRAKTPLRPERFVYPAGMTIKQVNSVEHLANPVRVADGIVVVYSQPPAVGKPGKDRGDWKEKPERPSPTDLYSTRTGQFIRRLDRPGCDMQDFQLVANDRWLIYYEYDRKVGKHPDCQLVIVSTNDGRELARLPHSTDDPIRDTDISPTGKWVVTLETDPNKKFPSANRVRRVRLWSSANWQQVENETSRQIEKMLKFFHKCMFVTDDVIKVRSLSPVGVVDDDPRFDANDYIMDLSRPGYHRTGEDFGKPLPYYYQVATEDGLLIGDDRKLIDAKTFARLVPPTGRRYHPDLAKLAPDGRFFENLDTVTEKELPLYDDGDVSDDFVLNFYGPGYGRFSIASSWQHQWQLYILPNPDKLNIPPAMLELWAQVVTGGELDTDGRFVPWDEPTWQSKQKQLAAMKPPYADFPFPGWVTSEPHLWWCTRANERDAGKEREKLMDEWRRRSGRVRPKPEPDTWRTPEVAPPPRDTK